MQNSLLEGWEVRTDEEEFLQSRIYPNHDFFPAGWKKLLLVHAEEDDLADPTGEKMIMKIL